MKQLIITGLLLSFLPGCEEASKCGEDVLCTYEFRIISLEITDDQGSFVMLDSTVISNLEKGDYQEAEHFSGSDSTSYYIIATDSDLEAISFEGSEFRFQGWLSNELVVDEIFVIEKDCCHINKRSGKDQVIIPTK